VFTQHGLITPKQRGASRAVSRFMRVLDRPQTAGYGRRHEHCTHHHYLLHSLLRQSGGPFFYSKHQLKLLSPPRA
jgi:hypothetical protein